MGTPQTPGYLAEETMTVIMNGDSHFESQRCLSLSRVHGPDPRELLSTQGSTLTKDARHTQQPSCLGTRISSPLPSSASLILTDLQEKGWDNSLSFLLTKRGRDLKQVCLRRIAPDILTPSSWDSGHSVQPIFGNPYVFLQTGSFSFITFYFF